MRPINDNAIPEKLSCNIMPKAEYRPSIVNDIHDVKCQMKEASDVTYNDFVSTLKERSSDVVVRFTEQSNLDNYNLVRKAVGLRNVTKQTGSNMLEVYFKIHKNQISSEVEHQSNHDDIQQMEREMQQWGMRDE